MTSANTPTCIECRHPATWRTATKLGSGQTVHGECYKKLSDGGGGFGRAMLKWVGGLLFSLVLVAIYAVSLFA